MRFDAGVKLFNYWRSSSSYRVRIALHFKGLAFEYVPVHLLQDEQHQGTHRARNPLGTVPVLETDPDESGRTMHIAQSVAIVEYLEERYPKPPLFPRSLEARAAMRALVEQVNSGIQPFHNVTTVKFLKNELKVDDRLFSRTFVENGLKTLEALAQRSAGTFMVGDAFTWADACLVPQLYGARRLDIKTEQFTLLTRLEAASLALEPVKLAAPERQIDAQ